MNLVIYFVFVGFIIVSLTYLWSKYKVIYSKFEVRIYPLVSGNVLKEPQKENYSICDFNERRKFKYQGGIIKDFNTFKQFVVYGNSMAPMKMHSGDGILAKEFDSDQKKNLRNKDYIKKNDIIICQYNEEKEGKNFTRYKSRRFIAFINLSLSTEELCEFARKETPLDENFPEQLRVHENKEIFENLRKKLEDSEKYPQITQYKKELENQKEKDNYQEIASNFILSITYKEKGDIVVPDYSIHPIDRFYGKVVYVISKDYISSDEVIKETSSSFSPN
jgi:hypothetical protein